MTVFPSVSPPSSTPHAQVFCVLSAATHSNSGQQAGLSSTIVIPASPVESVKQWIHHPMRFKSIFSKQFWHTRENLRGIYWNLITPWVTGENHCRKHPNALPRWQDTFPARWLLVQLRQSSALRSSDYLGHRGISNPYSPLQPSQQVRNWSWI